MSKFKRITLRLARNPDAGFPDGDPHHGYTIVAPLDDDGHLDAAAWVQDRKRCTVVRFAPDPDARADGWLTHHGARWSFHFDEDAEGPDEPLYRLGEHKFAADEYVSVMDRNGPSLVYRVTDVSSV